MAPEQAKGRSVNARADIWAFGCVLFEMLAGRAPFAGESVVDILSTVIQRDPGLVGTTSAHAGRSPPIVEPLPRKEPEAPPCGDRRRSARSR
jgi:serine/threonine-protein kinase